MAETHTGGPPHECRVLPCHGALPAEPLPLPGAFQNHSHIFFALEYIGGGDLWSRLQADGPMQEGPGRVVLAEVALALAHVHKRGCVAPRPSHPSLTLRWTRTP